MRPYLQPNYTKNDSICSIASQGLEVPQFLKRRLRLLGCAIAERFRSDSIPGFTTTRRRDAWCGMRPCRSVECVDFRGLGLRPRYYIFSTSTRLKNHVAKHRRQHGRRRQQACAGQSCQRGHADQVVVSGWCLGGGGRQVYTQAAPMPTPKRPIRVHLRGPRETRGSDPCDTVDVIRSGIGGRQDLG